MNTRLFETLQERGYIYQMTDEEQVKKLLNGEPTVAYVGIDPTADSLHIGHCLPLIMARHMQDAGHKIIVVLGGATAMIGDPSGKNEMRAMVSSDFVNKNRPGIEKAISHFLRLDGDNPAIVVNNADWYKGYEYIDFMRDIGVHFNVNKMLSCDAYTTRLANGGLTFFEMGYMLMQAYDFVYLNRQYGCRLEFGGSDQWANIVAGADLGRKLALQEGKDADTFQAFTNVLLLNADGKKMGKTEKGALWVDKDKCSPYDFYQYFYNCDDRDVEKLLRILTYVPMDEIKTIMQGDIRDAKKRMAYEITCLVHGVEEADKAVATAQSLFGQGQSANAPTKEISLADLKYENLIIDVLAAAGFVASKGEARRLIDQGGLYIEDDKITSATQTITKEQLANGILFRRGKKQYLKILAK
ncbi:MAG: tyrosine--tRNA ligase [Clostridia bacterium]|nr:tyrosine--tRNA ligase [Clostridia bacterium]